MVVSCTLPPPEPFNPPPTKQLTDGPNSLSEGLLTEYDIWEFLKENPSEAAVIEMLGAPDSVWASDEQPYYVMYYYRPNLQDYNSIELNTKSRRVTGYEWDE
ncbi:MAG: hypothetical protein QF842_03025 [Candidatus Marinimicrobia bacterium]|nr:hypothetical protein [Candidatus Neomarinimicrobiota bacterium]|tara:strand:- start:1724 stop:2029 length:306 start_codon:yes stop_codon:yes gene_type:complete